jgi:rRNA processing protein Gar1
MTNGMAGMSGAYTSGYTGATPTIGARVITTDGDELGKVKEVVGSCFKVDASMQPDYWLGTDTIVSSSGMEVQLGIAKDRVGDVKVDGPEHSGVHRHLT